MIAEERKLKNDLSVIIAPIEGTRAVTTLFLTGWGAIHEIEEKRGVAHFLEHMMFKGTKKRPSKKAISEELDAMGAQNNAFTSHEMTGYYVKAAEQHHDRATDILSDIVLNSLVPDKEVARERGVIIEEMRMNYDAPMRHVGDLFFDLVFKPHELRRNIIGTEETLYSIEREDIISFFNEGYRGGNSALVMAGAIDIERGIQMAENYFGDLMGGGEPISLPFISEQKNPQVYIETRSIDQSHLWFGCAGVTLDDNRRFVAEILATILGGNMSSRLFMEIREERGLAYYVETDLDAGKNYGLVFTRAGIETSQLADAVEVIVVEHRRLKEELVSDAELRKAREYIKGSVSLSLEDSKEVARFFIEEKVLGGEILTVDGLFSKIDSVTAEDIQALAQELFVPERINLAVITKEADEIRLRDILSNL